MGAVRQFAISLEGARRREFRRFLLASVLLHLLGFTLLAGLPTLPLVTPPGAIAVNLVAAPRPPGQSAAPPKPRAAPKPPKPAPVVLPREPTLPEPKPKPAPKPEAPPEPEAPVAQDYDDVLAQLRAELGEKAPEAPAEPVQTASAGGGAAGLGRLLSPEEFAWRREVRIHIRRNWVVPPGFRAQSLQTEIEVELDAGGVVRGEPRVRRRSGNPWYDDGVVRSIQKASPLPAPPEPGKWTFVMISDEVL